MTLCILAPDRKCFSNSVCAFDYKSYPVLLSLCLILFHIDSVLGLEIKKHFKIHILNVILKWQYQLCTRVTEKQVKILPLISINY